MCKMKKHQIGRILRDIIFVLVMAVFAVILFTGNRALRIRAAENTPTLEIRYHNLSYQDKTHLMFAVGYENLNPSKNVVELLVWDRPQTDGYAKGTEDHVLSASSRVTINGTPCLVFYSQGLAARQLTDTFYLRACVTVDGTIYYSEPSKYSAVQYITDILRRDDVAESDRNLVAALGEYGGAAQQRFNYHTERLASKPYYYVRIAEQVFDDGFDYGLFPEGTELPLSVEVPEGLTFRKWVDQDGNVVEIAPEMTLVVSKDETVRPVFDEPIDWNALAGRSFTATDNLQIPYFFPQGPLTIEATIQVPKSVTGRAGVILGNYGAGGDELNLEIYTNGRLRLYLLSGTRSWEVVFSTDLRSSTVKHIAVTIPEKSQSCELYVDGVLTETKTMPSAIPSVRDTLRVGGDYREGNTQYFKGTLYGLTIWNGIRSALEIADDTHFACDPDSAALAVNYLFDGIDDICDRSGNGKNLTDTRSGMSFASLSERYSLTKTFDMVPRTYEALFDTNADVSNNKGCTILGNYNIGFTPGISFRVYLDGRPSLCLRYDVEHQDQFFFPESILGEGRVHVAITLDDTYVYGYLNGKQVLKKAHCGYLPELTPYPFSLGGDNRTDNSWWFRDGSIYSVNVFSEYRTAEQIVADMNYIDLTDPTLILSYDFEYSEEDQSAFHNELCPYFYDGAFLDPSEYDYTFVCVGDTQTMTKLYPEQFPMIYDFILDHVDDLKIARVIGLGDITDDNNDEQWTLARDQIFRMDDVIPYTVIRGNHDHYARTAEAEESCELMFGRYFDNLTYRKQLTDCYNGDIANSYTRFTVGEIPYLLLNLDFGPGDDVLAWAGSVCDQFPNDNVIVATHAFLFHDGTTIDENDIVPPRSEMGENNCDEMWDKFVSLHENIVLVFCGHDPCNEIVVSRMTGVHGNTVTCFLIDPQYCDYYDRPSGQVALLHFKDGGRTILVENYATVEGKFFKCNNQFTVENIELIERP